MNGNYWMDSEDKNIHRERKKREENSLGTRWERDTTTTTTTVVSRVSEEENKEGIEAASGAAPTKILVLGSPDTIECLTGLSNGWVESSCLMRWLWY